MEPIVDVAFPLTGKSLPLDHGYPLFAAVSRLAPRMHKEPSWGIHPVYGLKAGPGVLRLLKQSLLTIRLPATAIADVLALAGKSLSVSSHDVAVGVPRIFPLKPGGRARSRFVTIKGFKDEPGDFEQALDRQVVALGFATKPIVKVGARRVMRVGSHKVVGFAVEVNALAPEDSIRLQVSGLGGRRHMGGGVFLTTAEVDE